LRATCVKGNQHSKEAAAATRMQLCCALKQYIYACTQHALKTSRSCTVMMTKNAVSRDPHLGAGVADAAAGAAGADCAAPTAAAAGACVPCLYQGVSPRFACIHDSFFQSSVCQSDPTMPPTSLLLALYTHLQRKHDRNTAENAVHSQHMVRIYLPADPRASTACQLRAGLYLSDLGKPSQACMFAWTMTAEQFPSPTS
jgi:hypothetical protein